MFSYQVYSYFEIQTIKDVHKQIQLIAYTHKLVRLKSNLYYGVLTSQRQHFEHTLRKFITLLTWTDCRQWQQIPLG